MPKQGGTAGKKFCWKDLARHIVREKLSAQHWCRTRPSTCIWWNVYCPQVASCNRHEITVCDWHHVTCESPALPTVQLRWYLGIKGVLLPGKGIGIDVVEAGSPAEAVGLEPGMVLTVCNGIQIIDEATMDEAIRTSGGVLEMTLLSADGAEILQGTVQMVRVAQASL